MPYSARFYTTNIIFHGELIEDIFQLNIIFRISRRSYRIAAPLRTPVVTLSSPNSELQQQPTPYTSHQFCSDNFQNTQAAEKR